MSVQVRPFLLVALLMGAAPDAMLAQGIQSSASNPLPAAYRPNQVFDVRRAPAPVRIDAHLDDPAWRDAAVIPLPIEITPRDNALADVETACRVAFDDENLYLGCEAFDPDPESIRAYITNRDGIFGNHDRISFLVDPFNDSRRGFTFEVSAVGVQADLSYDEQTDFDASWDGIWSSAGRITERGYIIEAAIPFRTLRFPSSDGVQTWRFWINRMRPRSEFVVLRTNTRVRGESCQLCQAHLLRGFSGMDAGLNLELVPTITGRQTASRAETFPAGPLDRGPARFDPGLDARWSITSNMSLNATVNPDFSQVEADAPQLDVNTAFALRFPEKRPFFLEGADLFRTPVEAVFTRSITDPSGGMKLTGKSGPHALGALAAVDEVNNLLFPGPFGSGQGSVNERVTSAVLRYRRDLGANNNLGGIATGRFGQNGYRNQLGGFDAYIQPTPRFSITAQGLASETQYDAATAAAFSQPATAFSGQAASTRLLYTGRSVITEVAGQLFTDGFRADAGFVPQTDYRGGWIFTGYNFRGNGGRYTLIQPGGGIQRNERINGEVLYEGAWFNLYYEGPLQSSGWLNPEVRRQAYDGEIHDLRALWTGFNFRPRQWLLLGLNGNVGDQIDFRNGGAGDILSVSPSFTAQVGRNIEIGSRHSFQRLAKGGAKVFTARVDEVRGVVNLDARTFVRATVQYRRTERNPATNPGLTRPVDESLFSQFLFSYKVNPLTVLFLGVTDDRAGFEPTTGEPVALTPRGLTLFMKLGYAWRP